MTNNKISITFLGDSIMGYKKDLNTISWLKFLKIKLNIRYKKKLKIYSSYVIGLNSRGLLNLKSDYFLKVKNKNILIIQIGINDSWHYRSFQGIPEVSLLNFKNNLNELVIKSKVFGFKEIVFINYHKLLNNRMEINNKTLNYNLNKYNRVLQLFCKKKKLKLINIRNKKFRPKIHCLPMPDGIHLNTNGARLYSKIIFNSIVKLLNEKKI